MKKPRRFVLTFEIETEAPIRVLRKLTNWNYPPDPIVRDQDRRRNYTVKILQVQANAIRKENQ